MRFMLVSLRPQQARDNPDHPDTSETVNVSPLALTKMLRHTRAGVPIEVMGLLVGQFVDDYSINVVDVFAMPTKGTEISVEAVDTTYQTRMLEMLKVASRTENIVGWYHSHPGMDCWLSHVDMNTQESFEALHPRAIAIVLDPIKSVRGKVVIEAFRLIQPNLFRSARLAPTSEPRQITSNIGNMAPPTLLQFLRGFDRMFYSLPITSRFSDKDQKMLECMSNTHFYLGLQMQSYSERTKHNEQALDDMVKFAKLYSKELVANANLSKKEIELRRLGRVDPKRHLEDLSRKLLQENIVQVARASSNAQVFR